MATALLDAGAAVAITGRDALRAEATARELGPRSVGIGMDVRDEDDVARGVDRVWDALGGLDVLVNNAGIGMRTVNPRFLTDPQPFWAVSPDGFRDLVATNLTGYFLVSREVVPRLLSAGGGPGGERVDEPLDDEPEGLRPLRSGARRRRGAGPDHGRRPDRQRRHLQHPAARRGDGDRDDPGRLPARAAQPAAGPGRHGAADRLALLAARPPGCTTSGSSRPSSTPGCPPARPDTCVGSVLDGARHRPRALGPCRDARAVVPRRTGAHEEPRRSVTSGVLALAFGPVPGPAASLRSGGE